MHTGTKRWCCGTCGKEHRLRSVFSAVINVYNVKWLVISGELTIHSYQIIILLKLDKFSGKKISNCKHCRSGLYLCEKTHQGYDSWQHVCPQCSKRFISKQKLTMHIR